jgi:hypothetical protein
LAFALRRHVGAAARRHDGTAARWQDDEDLGSDGTGGASGSKQQKQGGGAEDASAPLVALAPVADPAAVDWDLGSLAARQVRVTLRAEHAMRLQSGSPETDIGTCAPNFSESVFKNTSPHYGACTDVTNRNAVNGHAEALRAELVFVTSWANSYDGCSGATRFDPHMKGACICCCCGLQMGEDDGRCLHCKRHLHCQGGPYRSGNGSGPVYCGTTVCGPGIEHPQLQIWCPDCTIELFPAEAAEGGGFQDG